MKKLVFILLLAISIQAMAQIRTPLRAKQELYRVKKNCPSLVTQKITPAANNLIDSYKKLFENKANLCKGASNILTSFGLMESQYYTSTPPNKGKISFASFYEGIDLFRTIWGVSEGNFTYYGVCPPNPIVWPNGVTSQNHVYAVKFVTIENYVKISTPKNFLDYTGVPILDIKSIDCIKMEESNGYIAATDPYLYSSTASSRGILAHLTLTNNTQIICYIINNYDNAGTLIWKE